MACANAMGMADVQLRFTDAELLSPYDLMGCDKVSIATRMPSVKHCFGPGGPASPCARTFCEAVSGVDKASEVDGAPPTVWLRQLRFIRSRCPVGTYNLDDECAPCEGCAAGQVRQDCGLEDPGECVTCGAGRYAADDSSACLLCPPEGHICGGDGLLHPVQGGRLCPLEWPKGWPQCRDGSMSLELCGSAAFFCQAGRRFEADAGYYTICEDDEAMCSERLRSAQVG